jgi:hypothetical protein
LGDVPDGADRPCTVVNPFGATKKLHDLGTRLVAASPHQDAVCFCVRQPAAGGTLLDFDGLVRVQRGELHVQ